MTGTDAADNGTERGSGIRSVCDLDLTQAAVLSDPMKLADDLEPGDVIVFRNTDNSLSRLIAELDGYWCHSGIYVGENTIVHAALAGIATIDVDEILPKYPEGMAVARPAQSAEQRESAAAWALDLADPANHVNPARYSGRDLGLAWTLLRRAEKRGIVLVPENEDEEENAAAAGHTFVNYESTCSGLVYRAYAEAEAADPLSIATAPGIVLEHGRLRLLTDEEALLATFTGDGPEVAAMGAVGDVVTSWKLKAGLLWDAGKARSSLVVDGSISIEQGVTPADLWCSESIGYRAFFMAEHLAEAKRASADC